MNHPYYSDHLVSASVTRSTEKVPHGPIDSVGHRTYFFLQHDTLALWIRGGLSD
jgi:hypothetical protein